MISAANFNWRHNQEFVKRCAICASTAGVTRSYKAALDKLGLTDRKTDQAHPRCVIAETYKRGRER